MPLPSGFKTKEEYAAYMREYRKRKTEEHRLLRKFVQVVREDDEQNFKRLALICGLKK